MEPSVINGIIPEDIAPVMKKDGIFQVYTDCPTPYKGNLCTGVVQCLDGPPPEYKRTYRCGACQTEYAYKELSWRPATREETQTYLEYNRAWSKIQFDAYQMAGNVLQKKMQNRNTIACYGLEILKYAVLLVLYQYNAPHSTLTRSSIGDEFQNCSRSIACEIFLASSVSTGAVSIITPKKSRPKRCCSRK